MLCFIPVIALAAVSAGEIYVFTHPAMGTEFELRIAAPYEIAEPLAFEAFELVDALEDEISSWRDTSYTTYVNRHAAEEPVRVSPNVLELFVESKRLSETTFGAFDPTVGPLLDAWKIRRGEEETPSESAIADARERVGMERITIDETAATIAYERDGMWVDWGAVGKGFALDRVAERLRSRGVASALLSAGTSTILAIGAPPGSSAWKVRIPSSETEFPLRDAALSTSVCFENDSGPCDILDPRAGRPVSAASSATVVADTALAADALSTALLVMRRDEAKRFFSDHPSVRAVRYGAGGDPEAYNWIK